MCTIYIQSTSLICAVSWASLAQVNMWNGFDAGVPFGGYKTSGIGREKGEAALAHYTQV